MRCLSLTSRSRPGSARASGHRTRRVSSPPPTAKRSGTNRSSSPVGISSSGPDRSPSPHLAGTRSPSPFAVSRGAPSPPAAGGSGAAALVEGVIRAKERGETSEQTVLLHCLAYLSELELNASEGSTLLWMVAPVLRGAKEHLVEAHTLRQELEAEVRSLHERATQLDDEVEAKAKELRRAEETAAERVRRQVAAKVELEASVAQLRCDIIQVDEETAGLKWQATTGLAQEVADWAAERKWLEDEIVELEHEAASKKEQLNITLPELVKQLKEQIATDAKRVKLYEPEARAKAELGRRIYRQEKKREELQGVLEEIEAKKQAALRPLRRFRGTGRRQSPRRRHSMKDPIRAQAKAVAKNVKDEKDRSEVWTEAREAILRAKANKLRRAESQRQMMADRGAAL